MITKRELEIQVMELIPEIQDGMHIDTCFELIIKEIKRLKEIEAKYEGLCK